MQNLKNLETKKVESKEQATKRSPENNPLRPSYSPKSQKSKYQIMALKTKQQLKELQNRRKNQIITSKEKKNAQEIKNDLAKNINSPRSNRLLQTQKSLSNQYSQKHFKKEVQNAPEFSNEKYFKRSSKEERKQLAKVASDGKLKKGNYFDSSQYKKLHEKLDSLQNKISDMKKNLQKKKQEKQKIHDMKNKNNQLKEQKQSKKPKQTKVQMKLNLKGIITQMPEHTDLHTFHTNPYSPRHNVYYVSEVIRAYKDIKSLAHEHINLSLNILRMLEKSPRLTQKQIRESKLNLPRDKKHENKKSIVFDLDETLIHCNETINPPYDVKLEIKFPNNENIEAAINIRPYARQILKNLSRHFEVIIFTASHSCYANVVLDYLDPQNKYISHRLYREHCYYSAEGMYVKDLRLINRDLSEMLLVDNAAYSYAFQLENGVPILPYYHGSVDFELKMLEQYLMRMTVVKDVRQKNSQTFKLNQYKHYYNQAQKLVEELYLSN